MPPLEKLTLSEISERFTLNDEFYFDRWEDGFFTFFTNTEPFPQSITFYPSPFAVLHNPMDINAITAAIDTAKHYSLTVSFS